MCWPFLLKWRIFRQNFISRSCCSGSDDCDSECLYIRFSLDWIILGMFIIHRRVFSMRCNSKVGFPQALQGANEFHINTLPTHMHTITIIIKTRSKKRLRSFFWLVIKLYWNIKAIVIIFLWNSIWHNDIWNVETRLLTFSLHQHVIRHFTFRSWFVALEQDKEHLCI